MEVIEDHLYKGLFGDTEGDIATNYDTEVLLFTDMGSFCGHVGVQESAKQLNTALANGKFEYSHLLIDGKYAFLEWTGTSKDRVVVDGADSFMIENGKIIFQSIHYTVEGAICMEGDIKLQNYQDDFDTDMPDQFINKVGLSPADELGIPEDEYKDELDKIALDDLEYDNEDMREMIEDRDEADDNAASGTV